MLTDGIPLREQFRDFPIYQIAVVCVMRLAESIAHTQTFPYQYHMLRKFHIAKESSEIFQYNGYLFAAFSVSQTICNILWSKKSDLWGRKPVLILGLIGTAVSLLVYGFSGVYRTAMISKVIGGLFNANMAITRTVLGEIAPKRKHHFLSFATFPLMWNLGSMIGPIIGSKLKTPHKWNHAGSGANSGKDWHKEGANSHLLTREITGWRKTYPFALPNVVSAVILVTAAIVLILFLEETQKTKKNRRDYGLMLGDKIRSKLGFNVPARDWDLPKYSIITEQNESLVQNSEVEQEGFELKPLESTNNKASNLRDVLDVEAYAEEIHTIDQSKVFTFDVIQTIISHFLMLFHVLVYTEFLPVYLGATTQVEALSFPFHIKGGFGFDEGKISKIFSWNGVFGILMVIFVLPLMVRKLSALRTYRISLASFPICYFFLPLIIFTLPEYIESAPKFFNVMLIYYNVVLKEFGGVIAFSQIILLMHRAAPPQHRAMVNGYAMSISSLASIVSPLFWGWLMRTFDEISLLSIFWWILAFIAAIGYAQSYLLRDY